MSHPSKRASKLSPERLALLELLLEEEGLDSAPTPKIPRRGRSPICPLSFAQERLWFLDQLRPASWAYNLPTALLLIGPLDVAALGQSLNTIMQRHESLRTTFAMQAGRPVQVIAPAQTLRLPLLDLQALPPSEREAETLRLSTVEATYPFDLARGPLVRVALLRLDVDKHALLLTLHHIIADGWSVGVFTRELSTLYAAYAAGRPSALPELPIQYADYAVWQRGWLQGAALEQQLAYWRAQLADLPMLELPTDHLRPALPSLRGATHIFALPATLSTAVGTLSRQTEATLFMMLLAAWQLLLARYSQQDDIVVGTTIANRTQRETEPLIGFFINTLVLRTSLSGNPTFRELVGRVRKMALEAYVHQDLPFDHVVEALQPERTLSHHPLCQVMFGLQNAPTAPLELPSLTLRSLAVEHQAAKFDLGLSITETSGGLVGTLAYSTDLFDAPTLIRMAGHIQTLLEGIVAAPDRPVAHLPLLTNAERQQLLAEWDATAHPVPDQVCLHHLFEAQATRTPDAVALVFDGPGARGQGSGVRGQGTRERGLGTGDWELGDSQSLISNPQSPTLTPNTQHLSYRELNERANRLAHHLRALGVGSEVPVGLCLERSPELVVGLLGTLKAGGAYVPLDPAYPPERLAFMFEDARMSVLLTTTDHRPSDDGNPQSTIHNPQSKIVNLDVDWPMIALLSRENPASTVRADHLAYLIYTSGTTGRPKAVMVEHRQVVNTLYASQAVYQFNSRDRVPCLLSFSFDIALFECLSPLLVGGIAILIPEHQALDSSRWGRLLSEITFLHGPPSLLRQIAGFASSAGEGRYEQLRQVALGGDLIPLDLIQELQHTFTAAQIYVGYGPTEGTIMCTNCVVPRDMPPDKHIIGRPMQNMQVRLYDRNQQLVPIGVPGELYIGGAGVTRGYLRRPDLTAERFIPNPFAEGMGDKRSAGGGLGWGMVDSPPSPIPHPLSPGNRLYKTGDRARWRADGNLEFLGRMDQQVKVRGYRIELGEIETMLGQHPAVRECVVVTHRAPPDDKRLVVYVVPRSAQPPTISELRRFLQARLPEYMLPATFVFLGVLPLTSNGKVDRRALPAPGQARPELEKAYVAPGTELEQVLAGMWQEMLGVEAVGTRDNFFELGGNSIQAAIFINKLQERSGEVVYVVAVFDAPTIVELATYLTKRYPHVVAKLCATPPDRELEERQEIAGAPQPASIGAAKVARLRQVIPALPPRAVDESARIARNPPAIFILSPPRSGSTLLRVMLAGHPRLFAPPGFELLSFNTLLERRDAFAGRNRFWLEGTIRAIMEMKGCDPLTAERIMAECENQNLTVQQFYRLMQEWIGEKVLVDKSPSYTLDAEVLKRAEADFDQPLYIHLLRHPYGMIRSFEEAKSDQVFFRYPHDFTTRELAELIWLISHQNTVEFLRHVPERRQHRVRFEDLVTQPRLVLERICDFLGLGFHPAMLEPYKETKQRMTDGIHAFSKMVGDVKFHQHRGIDATVSERWKQYYTRDFLGEITWQMAETFGYARVVSDATDTPAPIMLTPIRPVPRDGSVRLPLSFAQQRLWFFDQLQPGSSAYNVPSAVRLTGSLDIAALEQSLNGIARRHETLRTTFHAIDGQPVQVIGPPRRVPLPLIDLRALAISEREAVAQRLVQAEAQRPFDLSRGPLLRVRLLRLDDSDHVVAMTMHHIIADAWSMGVFIRELTTLYAAAAMGQPAPLPGLPIQYADYALWQREWLEGSGVGGQGSGVRSQELGVRSQESDGGESQTQNSKLKTQNFSSNPPSPIEAQLAYWKRQLADLPILELPSDHPRPAIATLRGAHHDIVLPQTLSEGLAALGQREGATLFMTLLAAWQLLLARYSRQDDIVVGTPIAGRTRKETEGMIGFFVNTLTLRTDLAGCRTFYEVLRRVRKICLEAYAYQEVPFEQVVEALQPARDLSRNPLFQVMFTFQNAPAAAVELSDLRLRPIAVEQQTTQFDLSLSLTESGARLAGMLEFSTDLFTTTTITRLLGHFETLLEGIVAHPELSLAELPILTAAERQQLLVDWNATTVAYSHDQCLHQLFEAQVERTPDAIAVAFDGPLPGVRGQGSEVRETRRQGDKETKPAPSANEGRQGARSQESEFLAPTPHSPLPNPHSPLPDTRRPIPNTQHPTPNTQHLTYQELNRRANQLARYLQRIGVGLEVRVGICLERSPELMIGLLGVLKAGAACLPLDPTYPAARLAFILDDAQVAVLLATTDDHHQGSGVWGQESGVRSQKPEITDRMLASTKLKTQNSKLKTPAVVNLDADWPVIAGADHTNPDRRVHGSNLAYVIYTSGSTGRPKGVLIAHQSLVNYTQAITPWLGLHSGDRVLQLAALGFDVVLEEIFPAWTYGATVVLDAAGLQESAAEFGRLLTRAQVTVMELPAAYWHTWVDELARSGEVAPATLRLVLLGCEKPALDRLARWQSFGIPLIYVFGLTETTITSTLASVPVNRDPAQADVELPIGRPIANTQTYVLDQQMRPLPVGVPGELYIGGAGVARGYLGRPDLTAERFLPNPFAQVLGDGCWVLGVASSNTQHPSPNTRLHRTGDRVRYRTDGNLEFLGRIDEQIKVRGFRVEPGEVEAVLREHPSVREGVVLLREDVPGEKRLVAYVVQRSGVRGQGPGRQGLSRVGTREDKETRGQGLPRVGTRGDKETADAEVSTQNSKLKTQNYPLPQSPIPNPQSPIPDLRAFLKAKLPDYMVPSIFVFLDVLPLAPNGKVDRRALPAPGTARPAQSGALVAPRTPTEELLAQIWADMLRVEQVGVDDNFFASGGHSLLATRMISRMRDAFQVELPLRTLFEAPTIAGLAERIEAVLRGAPDQQPPPLRPIPRQGALPLSFAQQRLWFLDQLQPGSTTYIIPSAIRLTGRLDMPALKRSLSEIVRRHEALRTTFAHTAGHPFQVIEPLQALPLPLLDLRALPEHMRESIAQQLAIAESQQPFDLARGPLLRATMLRLHEDDHVALLTMHHIVSDAWSMEVLVHEMTTLYAAFVAGRPSPLPELPIQYADYAVWQRAWLQGSGAGGQGTIPLPPPTGGGIEGGAETRRQGLPRVGAKGDKETRSQESGVRSQESDVGTSQTQNSTLKTQNSPLEAQLAYWRRQLADLPVLELPTDRPRPLIATFQGARQDVVLAPALCDGLHTLSRQTEVTLFMTLLAAWQILLARYSGQDDVAVGTPIANRNRTETEQLIGFFLNTLVLRTDLSGNPSFRAALRRVREVCLSAYACQDLPFEQIVEALQPARDLSRHPLFQVVFTLEHAPATAPELPELAIQPLVIAGATARFDLSLSLIETPMGLAGTLIYSTDLFEAETITRLIEHFLLLLEGIVADPDLRLADLPLLTAAEQRQLADWNATQTDYPHDRCLHDLFTAQARRSPDAIAVVFDGSGSRDWETTQIPNPQSPIPNPQCLAYYELNRRANQLAHRLQRMGVGPEMLVALCVERSPDLIVGLLGILKAGAAYVPLDPAYPPERLAFMLGDCHTRFVLIQERLLARLPDHKAQMICLDTEWEQIAHAGPQDSISRPRPTNLVYAIYTSGSTGAPKGVLVTHQNVIHSTWARVAYYRDPPSRFLLLASSSFDSSVAGIFWTLCCGGVLVLPPEGQEREIAQVANLIVRHRISHLTSLPSLYALLLAQLPAQASATLRLVIVAGEACPAALVEQHQVCLPQTRLYNEYGPTESTVWASVHACCTSDVTPIPIGRPIPNMQLYLLDPWLHPVPFGGVGEVYLGGAGLARGYLGRPDLTAERFIPNPFAEGMGDGGWVSEDSTPNTRHPRPITRLYRTGDRGRFRPDGTVEFLGRIDQQVKVRGYRIELGEIEAMVRQYPAVQEAVVIVREDIPADKRLVAYLVISDKSQVTSNVHSSLVTELRAFLQAKLPGYMVPSAFVVLVALPLMPNGKINRRALPPPEEAAWNMQTSYVAPRDRTEQRLVHIWEELLGVRPIGVSTSFFDLGGHSLLAVSLMAHIQQQFGHDLPLSTLFQRPTVEYLAGLLRAQITPPLSSLVTLQSSGSKPPFFLVHPAGGTALCYLELAHLLGPDQSCYGLQAQGLEDEREPYTRVEDIAAHYVAALRTVQPHGPYRIGGWSTGGVVAFEMAQQLHQQGQAVSLLALLDTQAPVLSDEHDLPELNDADVIAMAIGGRQPARSRDAEQLDPDVLLNEALEFAHKTNLLPPDAGLVQVRRLIRVFRANILSTMSYVPQVYPDRITLFKTEIPAADASAPEDGTPPYAGDETRGWHALSSQPVRVFTIPGTHETMVFAPHVQSLAELLRRLLSV